jgi:hypothetical protein
MDTIGALENVVIQHRAVRTVRGWLDLGLSCHYVAVPAPGAMYLFKIVYDFPRPDVVAEFPGARGVLAEIVYGTDDITARLIRADDPGVGLACAADLAPLGRVRCADAVLQGLSGPTRPR